MANSSKQRHLSLTRRSAIAKEVCDIITVHAMKRFSHENHLVASNLFYTENYKEYSQKFPGT
jgi:hypothetical protein